MYVDVLKCLNDIGRLRKNGLDCIEAYDLTAFSFVNGRDTCDGLHWRIGEYNLLSFMKYLLPKINLSYVSGYTKSPEVIAHIIDVYGECWTDWLIKACRHGCLETVKVILCRISFTEQDLISAIKESISYGHVSIVEYLAGLVPLTKVDVQYRDYMSYEILEIIGDRIADRNRLLLTAVKNNNLSAVMYFKKYSPPHIIKEALRMAKISCRRDIVDYLSFFESLLSWEKT